MCVCVCVYVCVSVCVSVCVCVYVCVSVYHLQDLHGFGNAEMVVGEPAEESFVPFGQAHDETGRGVSQRHDGKAVIVPIYDQTRS